MKKYFDIIKASPLFTGIDTEQLNDVLLCMQYQIKQYEKSQIVLLSDSPVDTIGIVLSGTVQIMREDSNGKQSLLAELHQSEMFGEVFACAGIVRSPVSVLATKPTKVLHLKYNKLITSCSKACVFHQKLIENMLLIIARKNLMLHQKLEIIAKRTTRERVLLFLQRQCNAAKKCTIMYNREQLADYLCVDRSALSAELSRMQQASIIKFNKNNFEII